MSGVLMSREDLIRAAEMCERNGAWLVVDNAYEYFVYEGRQHHCVTGNHVLHIFSFSKVHPYLIPIHDCNAVVWHDGMACGISRLSKIQWRYDA